MHWRDNQRLPHEAGKFTPDRKARLNAIGFQWQGPGGLRS